MEELQQEEIIVLENSSNVVEDIQVDKITELKKILEQEELKRKKHKKVMILLSTLLLIGTPTLSMAGSYFGNQLSRRVQKSNVVSNITTLSRGENLGISEIISKTSPSVVEIQSTNEELISEFSSAGSGVIISEDGYIVTNYHVLSSGRGLARNNVKIKVILSDGEEHEAKFIGGDPRTDLAVIKVELTGLSKAEIANSDEVVVGENAIAIGNSLGTLGGTVTKGIVSAVSRESNVGTYKLPLIQTDAPINRGNSGGGLFNESGQLIGIVTQKLSGSTVEGLGFAIPSNIVVSITKDIIENGFVKNRATIGINIQEVTPSQLFRSRLEMAGVYVSDSTNAALQRYDLLKEINGVKIETASDVLDSISQKKVGDIVEATIVRDGKEQKVQITLKEASQ